MTDQEPPRIEFPCDYPIKVIVETSDIVVEEVVRIAQRHDENVSLERIRERPSKQGTYRAITIEFRATGEAQLKRLFEELKACEAVRMVL